MVLSDRTIKEEIEAGRLVFDPYDESLVQPSSVDVRVDRSFRVFNNSRYPYIDVRKPMEELTELVSVEDEEPFVLHPGEFVLGQTLERVKLPPDLVARLEGKSSLGRLGLVIHSTAGFVDPGFEGNLTLELSNLANLPITIYHGMPIGQISFMRMDGLVENPYGGGGRGLQVPGPGRSRRPAATTSTSTARPARRLQRFGRGGTRPSGSIRFVPNIGPLEIAIVLVIVLIIFGPKRLPELGRSMGRGIREFRGSISGDHNDQDDVDDKRAELHASEAAGGQARRSRSRARSSPRSGPSRPGREAACPG